MYIHGIDIVVSRETKEQKKFLGGILEPLFLIALLWCRVNRHALHHGRRVCVPQSGCTFVAMLASPAIFHRLFILMLFCRSHCNNWLCMHFYCVSLHLYIILLMVQTAQCWQSCDPRMNGERSINWIENNGWKKKIHQTHWLSVSEPNFFCLRICLFTSW